MKSKPSSPSIRDSLADLVLLLEAPWTARDDQLYDTLNISLERLELALGDGESEPHRSKSLEATCRTHPRLISICDEFQRDGRRLLRQAALVVRLSARNYDADKAPLPELRTAIASLIDAVDKYLQLEEDLTEEAAQDLGGEA